MQTIPLTRGYFATVDDEDYESMMQWKWHAVVSHYKQKIKVYAARNPGRGGKSRYFLMHRVLTNAGKGVKVDHRDGNGLNNSRDNLRLCSHQQNLQNTGLSINNLSGVKGVSWSRACKKWRARFVTNRKETHLGVFDTKEEAVRAYDLEILLARGQFAVTNESLGTVSCR